jgi:hypothetical protein
LEFPDLGIHHPSHLPFRGKSSLEWNVPAFGVSADGRWVVYRADQDTDNVWELYSVGESAIYLPLVTSE